MVTRKPIAVLMPTHNDGEKLRRAAESLRPSLSIADIFVVDDASDPPASDILRASTIPVSILRLDRNVGITKALNSGLRKILADGYEFAAIALDTGGAIKGAKIDVLVADLDAAWNFGRQAVEIRIDNEEETE